MGRTIFDSRRLAQWIARTSLGQAGVPGFESIMRTKMQVFLSSLGQCVSSIAVRYGTYVLLVTRDALLLNTKIPPHAKRSFRVLPLSGFWPQVVDMLHQVSERARDSVFFRPQFSQALRVGVLLRVGGKGNGVLVSEV